MTSCNVALAACLMLFTAAGADAQDLRGPCKVTAARVGPTTAVAMQLRRPPLGLTSCSFSLRGPFPAVVVGQNVLKGFALGNAQALRVSPGHGTVETFDGTVRYTPEMGYVGIDAFTIDVEHADLGASAATVSTVNVVVTTD